LQPPHRSRVETYIVGLSSCCRLKDLPIFPQMSAKNGPVQFWVNFEEGCRFLGRAVQYLRLLAAFSFDAFKAAFSDKIEHGYISSEEMANV